MNKEEFSQMATDNFYKQGYSCSESIAKAAAEAGYVNEELINAATAFSGGMQSGCLCGAIAGSQLVLGALYGKNKTNTARALGKEFLDEFKKNKKATCCRVLTANFEHASPERKLHCVNIVQECSMILNTIVEREMQKTKTKEEIK